MRSVARRGPGPRPEWLARAEEGADDDAILRWARAAEALVALTARSCRTTAGPRERC
jgi:hypothetical protein